MFSHVCQHPPSRLKLSPHVLASLDLDLPVRSKDFPLLISLLAFSLSLVDVVTDVDVIIAINTDCTGDEILASDVVCI